MSIPICIDCADGGIINCGSINDVKYIYDINAIIYIMKQDGGNQSSTNNSVNGLVFGFFIPSNHQAYLSTPYIYMDFGGNIVSNWIALMYITANNINFYCYPLPSNANKYIAGDIAIVGDLKHENHYNAFNYGSYYECVLSFYNSKINIKFGNTSYAYNNYVVRTKWTADQNNFSDRYILFKITNVMMTDINQ